MYYVVSIIVFVVIVALMFVPRGSGRRQMTSLGLIALILVVAGSFFSDSPEVGYSLIGAGLVLSIYDMLRRGQSKSVSQPPTQTPPSQQ